MEKEVIDLDTPKKGKRTAEDVSGDPESKKAKQDSESGKD